MPAKKKAPKYKNLHQLAAAFASGELDKKHYVLVLDNDNSSLRYVGPLPKGVKKDSDAADDFIDEKDAEAGGWFRGNGYSDLMDACLAAGIPSELC